MDVQVVDGREYVLILFVDKEGGSNLTSKLTRATTIAALRHLADSLESGEDGV
jgi:hypothetical protein